MVWSVFVGMYESVATERVAKPAGGADVNSNCTRQIFHWLPWHRLSRVEGATQSDAPLAGLALLSWYFQNTSTYLRLCHAMKSTNGIL